MTTATHVDRLRARVDRLAELFCRAQDAAADPADPAHHEYRAAADELLDEYDDALSALSALETP